MREMNNVQQLIEKLYMHETIDGLHFWGPALQLSTDHSQYDEVTLSIKDVFTMTKNCKAHSSSEIINIDFCTYVHYNDRKFC